jgi:hypothetical protein
VVKFNFHPQPQVHLAAVGVPADNESNAEELLALAQDIQQSKLEVSETGDENS